MAGWASKVDANQAEIVQALRDAGATVTPLHRVGQGVPDLLIGYRGANLLLEVKMPGKGLNDRELAWHLSWRGQAAIVESAEDALAWLNTVRG